MSDEISPYSELYYINENSPSGLSWKVNIYSGRWKNLLNVSAGDPAGGVGNSGYYQVRVNKKLTLVHRIIWEMSNGKIPQGMFIDHIDGNRVNNKLSNLRVVPRTLNARNAKVRADSTSGLAGVNYCLNTLKSGKQVAYWRAIWVDLDGNSKSKGFRVDVYGESEAKQMAIEYRNKMIEHLNEQGAGYSEKHGK